jgi:hypothetical protein
MVFTEGLTSTNLLVNNDSYPILRRLCRMSAYQDLMTALVTRRRDQSAAEDERVVLAALAKHAHELAVKQRNWGAEAEGFTDPQMAVYAAADLIDPEAQE